MLSVTFKPFIPSVIMMNVTLLSVIMLNVAILRAVILSVVALNLIKCQIDRRTN
jgi:hypothetical protein